MPNSYLELSAALESEGFKLVFYLIEVRGDLITQICVIEKETRVAIFHSSSFNAVQDFVKEQWGTRWLNRVP